VIGPDLNSCIGCVQDANGWKRTTPDYIGICEYAKGVPKRGLRRSEGLIGLAVRVDGRDCFLMEFDVNEKGECDHRHGWRKNIDSNNEKYEMLKHTALYRQLG
jgi:hypothetical protein